MQDFLFNDSFFFVFTLFAKLNFYALTALEIL